MTRCLSVNINKVALLRNARGEDQPNIIEFSQKIESLGVDSITVHPRPDERHIRYSDLEELKKSLPRIKLNVEGYPSEKFLSLITRLCPYQCTLVPDDPNALTSNNGWNCKERFSFLKSVVSVLKSRGIRTSIFINPAKEQIPYAQKTGAEAIELYTYAYAYAYARKEYKAIGAYKEAAFLAHQNNLRVHAGHDLNQKNLSYLLKEIPCIKEVSIGHALISEMLYQGIHKTISRYLKIINGS